MDDWHAIAKHLDLLTCANPIDNSGELPGYLSRGQACHEMRISDKSDIKLRTKDGTPDESWSATFGLKDGWVQACSSPSAA
jgi:hypothetical protein